MIIAADSNFGTILYDATGQPIYLFNAETSTVPECYDECAQAWPPVLTTGTPRAKGAVQSDLLGSSTARVAGTDGGRAEFTGAVRAHHLPFLRGHVAIAIQIEEAEVLRHVLLRRHFRG